MKKNKFLLAMASVGLFATAGSAFAVGNTQLVQVAVTNSCTVAAPAGVTFSSHPAGYVLSADESSTADNAVVTCDGIGTVKLGVDSGTNGTTTQRRLKHSSAAVYMPYSITGGGIAIGTDTLASPGSLPFTANAKSFTSAVGANNTSIVVTLPAQTFPTTVGTYSSTLTYYVEF